MCNKMSDVRLSNASPTVERVDARPPDNVRPPVRRNLFGSPDRDELRRYLETATQEGVRDFKEKYNYDPVDDRPLTPRNYDWQPDEDPPEFYLRPPHGSQQPRRRDGDSSAGSNRQDAAENGAGQPVRQPDGGGGSRKRRSADSGPCSDECRRKKSCTDEDDDDQSSCGAAAIPAVNAAEERPSRPVDGAAEQ